MPFFTGAGNLSYPFAMGSKIALSKAKLNLNTALLTPSKHSSVALSAEKENEFNKANINNILNVFLYPLLYYIYNYKI